MHLVQCPTCRRPFSAPRRPLAVECHGDHTYVIAVRSALLPIRRLVHECHGPRVEPPDAPDLRPLATDATGIGAFQANFGIAFEHLMTKTAPARRAIAVAALATAGGLAFISIRAIRYPR